MRGAFGDLIPLGGGGHDTLINQLAIGCTLTDHDVSLFGDLTLHVSAVADTPLAQGQRTSVTLTPGLRTHLGRDWYFLAGLPTPLTSARLRELGMIFWFMKAGEPGWNPAQAAERGGLSPSAGVTTSTNVHDYGVRIGTHGWLTHGVVRPSESPFFLLARAGPTTPKHFRA
jgi:hypothetical protein